MSILNHTFPPMLSGIYEEKLANQLANTQAAIVSLNQSRKLLHNPELLMKPILTKEAEASSRLEGTQASLEDVYKYEIEDQPEFKKQDILEIRNYEAAMTQGIQLIKNSGKLNNTTIRAIHKILLRGVRGQDKLPGEFRTDKVWVGAQGTSENNARYMPPEAVFINSLMGDLEKYIIWSKVENINPIISCGVIHHRFEAIHPFKDGNGRTGRLLISLYLLYRDLLDVPMLYASGYFEKHRENYMNALSAVDTKEDWKTWLMYFMQGLESQAIKSLELASKINDLYRESENKVKTVKSHVALIEALEQSFVFPFITTRRLNKAAGIPMASSRRYLKKLMELELLTDIGTFSSQRVYVNTRLMDILKNV